MEYLIVKWLHVMSSTVLFGTGIGTAFYLLTTSLTRDVRAVAVVTRLVVRADWLFTATTVVLQPLTGVWLVHLAGLSLDASWLWVSIVLYGFAVLCWLPVVWLQIRLRDLAQTALREGSGLPPRYRRLLGGWFALGVPALMFFLAVFWLMVAKPVF